MNRKKKRIAMVAIIAFVLLGFYVIKSISYQTRFLPNTKIAGIDFTDKTIREANQILQKHYRNQKFHITENNQELFTFTGADIGITDNFTKKLIPLKEQQNSWAWPARFFTKNSQKNELKDVTYDEATFTKFFATLPLTSEKRIQPENAKIEKNATGFEITPEVIGNTFDLVQVRASLIKGIEQGKTTISLEGTYQKPAIMKNNSDLTKTLEKVTTMSKTTVSYMINSQTETVPPEKLFSWIFINEENQPTIDEAAIATYINELSTTYSTKGKERKFKSTKRGEVKVPAGTYGWTLLPDTEAESLASDLIAGTNLEERDPAHEGSGYGKGLSIGDTYVEVDLNAQHMWYYRDGKVAIDTDIVSGKPTTPTPVGTFYIWNREPNAILRGENYATPVSYWMPIDWDGVGIHDSSWQPAYGGKLYLTKGSHGCINTPPGIMAQLFEEAEVGTPVLIF